MLGFGPVSHKWVDQLRHVMWWKPRSCGQRFFAKSCGQNHMNVHGWGRWHQIFQSMRVWVGMMIWQFLTIMNNGVIFEALLWLVHVLLSCFFWVFYGPAINNITIFLSSAQGGKHRIIKWAIHNAIICKIMVSLTCAHSLPKVLTSMYFYMVHRWLKSL
jgi:hypothetical protein